MTPPAWPSRRRSRAAFSGPPGVVPPGTASGTCPAVGWTPLVLLLCVEGPAAEEDTLSRAAYVALPHRFRWAFLLLASCAFYMAFVPAYILILLFTVAVDYVAGLLIERSSGWRRRAWLAASILANCGILAVFKYFNFLNDST